MLKKIQTVDLGGALMSKESLGKCPFCGENMKITKLYCSSCNTSIEGEFELCDFCKLSKEQKKFIKIFLKNKGSIKEMERELSISYPTVKNRLESIVSALHINK